MSRLLGSPQPTQIRTPGCVALKRLRRPMTESEMNEIAREFILTGRDGREREGGGIQEVQVKG